jgi:hypothetical protein
MDERYIRYENRKKQYINDNSLKINESGDIIKIYLTKSIKNILKNLISEEDIRKLFIKGVIKTKKLLNKIYKNLKDNHHRAAHPDIFVIFYKELLKIGIKYKYLIDNDTIELEFKDGHKLRQQIQESFKIYDKIILEDLKKLSNDFFESSKKHNFIVIEECVSNIYSDKNYIDMTIRICDDIKVYIEINEDHHNPENDIHRSYNIYLKNNTLPVLIYKDDVDINEIMKDIWKQISFGLFKKNKKDALTIYLNKVDDFDLNIIRFFIEIDEDYKTRGIPLKKLRKFLENTFNLKKKVFESFIIENIDNGDITSEDYFDNNIETPLKSKINIEGFDCILMSFKETHFKGAKLIKRQYSNFKVKYKKVLEDIMSGREEIISMLKEKCKKSIIQSKIHFYTHSINQKIITKLNINPIIHKENYLFIRETGSHISKEESKRILEKELYKYIENVNERKNKFNNSNYIGSNEYLEIIKAIDDFFETIKNSDHNLDSALDSDEEDNIILHNSITHLY